MGDPLEAVSVSQSANGPSERQETGGAPRSSGYQGSEGGVETGRRGPLSLKVGDRDNKVCSQGDGQAVLWRCRRVQRR